MFKKPIYMPYKGSRDYLRGADMYRAILPEIKERYIDLNIHRFYLKCTAFAKNKCELWLQESPDEKPGLKTVADVKLNIEGVGPVVGWLIETDKLETNRLESSDQDVFEPSVIEGDTINICTQNVAIEVIVSHTKKLHEVYFEKQTKKWILTGFDFLKPLEISDLENLKVSIDFERNFLTQSTVSSKNEKLGTVLFILV